MNHENGYLVKIFYGKNILFKRKGIKKKSFLYNTPGDYFVYIKIRGNYLNLENKTMIFPNIHSKFAESVILISLLSFTRH